MVNAIECWTLTVSLDFFSVDNISQILWNKSAFDDLVISDHHKDLVRSLVSIHKEDNQKGTGSNATKQNDIIAGKGNGLIMLLHGSPGTGKTLTAGK